MSIAKELVVPLVALALGTAIGMELGVQLKTVLGLFLIVGVCALVVVLIGRALVVKYRDAVENYQEVDR